MPPDFTDEDTDTNQPRFGGEVHLGADELRRSVSRKIEDELGKSVFKSLQAIGTESLLVYLILISLKPILENYHADPEGAKELIQKILPQKYSILERYLLEEVDKTDLVTSIKKAIERDNKPYRSVVEVFESLLIFTEVIPTLEELFCNKEWILKQVHDELRSWHNQGKFQRLDITTASEQMSSPSMLRGDLQVRISASKPTVVAGQEFSVFVVIHNPFEVPLVLYSVETQIPVEIVDIVEKQRRRTALLSNDPSLKRRKNNFLGDFFRSTVDQLRLDWKLASEPDNRIAQAVSATEIDRNRKPIDLNVTMQIENLQGGSATGALIERYQTLDIMIDSASPKHIDSILWRFEAFKRGVVPIVLQPGNSVVKQFIFRTRSWLFFTPLAHTLQIQVYYSVDNRDHSYTIPFDLTIQAEIRAVMIGAIVGSAVGGMARLLSDIKSNQNLGSPSAGILSILLAVILSAITVVSFARKSGTQQIVSVEDFWGGLFLGFLIGFLGQEFALNLITPKVGSPAPS